VVSMISWSHSCHLYCGTT